MKSLSLLVQKLWPFLVNSKTKAKEKITDLVIKLSIEWASLLEYACQI